jgi:hypothetical protein
MTKRESTKRRQEPLPRRGKRPPRNARIHRRRMLAMQRRKEGVSDVGSRA